MEHCVFCNKRIWFWQKTGYNSSWHASCAAMNAWWYTRIASILPMEYRMKLWAASCSTVPDNIENIKEM